MLRKMTQKFRNYKSCKFNINLIILHISSQEENLVRWSQLQSCLQGVRAQVRILAAVAFFFNFSLFHDRLNQLTVRSVFSVEPRFIRFSHNSLIPNSLGLKNLISIRFSVFPVGLSGPVWVNFFLFHDRLNQPMVRLVFSVETRFIRFSHNSLIPNSLGLKNLISIWFPVFPVGPSGPV